ncbi:multiubiquitin domain-containing protein [uncultured Imperialibacter sp.]|uniref:multiubiquitin domain-containing protein n=1 Tax=uncultured Imperialibacter sp. TaxID=1672639 RepID=UPI0030D9C87C|tara:strand:- start:11615 stop:12109 length:495 start_codon:yes stop_codon:yes gene_type:complete
MSKETDKDQKHEDRKGVLHFSLNEKHYEWHQEYITGAEIRQLGNIPIENEIFLAIKRPWKDELIPDNKEVNLARPEVEHFYSKEEHFKVALIVNLKEKSWIEKTITFEQVITLAYGSHDTSGSKGYTVTYDRGPHQNPEGAMDKEDRVFVKNKMIFNVKQTDKS